MRNICCLNQISHYGTDRLTGDYKLVDDIKDAEGILVRSASLHETEFPAGLEAVARAGAGVNNIPLDECAKKGIVVFNTPGANKNGVKELVLAGLFLTSRDVVGGIGWCREHAGEEDIAKKMEKSKKAFAGNEIKDYITVHVPLLDSTKEMINKDAFDQMKDGVVILNYARDLLVNDDDMAEALKCGKVKKYITDFPNAKTSAMEGVIATPHLGASTEESEDNCAVMAADELKDYLENGNIKNSVNYPACDMGICQVAGRIGLLHANIPNMIGQITSILAAEGINIANMTNKSRDKYAYTLLDLENPVKEEAVAHLEKISGMYKVRVIKG